jgi:D-amino-acid dehydrogenase
MKVIVMGAGVVGATTAYYLAKDGHEVTILDRQDKPAMETSFQNAGLLAVAHAFAWASPRAPKVLLRSLWDKNAALIFRLNLDLRMYLWSAKFLRNCSIERYKRNTLRKLRICQYSQQMMQEMRTKVSVRFDDLQRGLLYMFRHQAHMDMWTNAANFMTANGVKLEAKTRDEVARIEPAFEPVKHLYVGGFYCPTDESGDARVWTEKMVELAKAAGAKLELGATIRRLKADGSKITGVVTDKGERTADCYVLSLGSFSPHIARSVGVDLPIYPIKGYTAAFPCNDGHLTPMAGGVDEGLLVAWGKFGDTFRVGGKAEFAGYDTSFKPSDFSAILRTAREIFPNACDWSAQPRYWACLRPMTPDGPPIFGTAKYSNLHINTGHGHIGWTMACGSARICADLVQGKKPAIDMEGLTHEGRDY